MTTPNKLYAAMNAFGSAEDDDNEFENFNPNAFFNLDKTAEPQTAATSPSATTPPQADTAQPDDDNVEIFQPRVGGALKIESQIQTNTAPPPAISPSIEIDDKLSGLDSIRQQVEEFPQIPLTEQQTAQPDLGPLNDLDELAKIATEINPTEMANIVGNRSNGRVIIGDVDELKLNEQEDEITADQINAFKSGSSGEILSQTGIKENLSPYTPPQMEFSDPPLPAPVGNTDGFLGLPFTMTKFGPKILVERKSELKPSMLDFRTFAKDAPYEGDVYVEKVVLVPYRDKPKQRCEFHVILANGFKTTANRFEVSMDQKLEPLKEAYVGRCLKFKGTWNEYKNNRNMVVDGIFETIDTAPEDFLGGQNSMEPYEKIFNFLMNSVQKQGLRTLLHRLFIDDGYLEKMKVTPAALSMHDSGPGGLFKHTIKDAIMAYTTCMIYADVDSDVVTTTTLCHDIGKVLEMGQDEYTIPGIATGHIVLGHSIVRDKIIELQREGVKISNSDAQNILHGILAHHGQLEWGSPVAPVTREAMIVHGADYTESKITNINETLQGGITRGKSYMLKRDVVDLSGE